MFTDFTFLHRLRISSRLHYIWRSAWESLWASWRYREVHEWEWISSYVKARVESHILSEQEVTQGVMIFSKFHSCHAFATWLRSWYVQDMTHCLIYTLYLIRWGNETTCLDIYVIKWHSCHILPQDQKIDVTDEEVRHMSGHLCHKLTYMLYFASRPGNWCVLAPIVLQNLEMTLFDNYYVRKVNN